MAGGGRLRGADRARHHADYQCPHRAQGEPHGLDYHGWLSRRAGNRTRGPLRYIRPVSRAACALGRAAAAAGSAGAGGCERGGVDAPRRRGRAAGLRLFPGRRGRGRGHRLFARVPEFRARAARPGLGASPIARCGGGCIPPSGTGIPRVRTHLDHGGQCLCPAPGRALSEGLGRGIGCQWRACAAAHHAVQRRFVLGGHGR